MDNEISPSNNLSKQISKTNNFPNKILFINGWEGCGKTCVTNVFKSLDGVENMKYSLEIELLCHLWLSEHLDLNSTATTISLLADNIIYKLFQSREINIRPSDLSSIFRSPIWYKYIARLFSKGGEDCVSMITNKTILNLVTHNLFPCIQPLQKAFKNRLIFIEVTRDPIFMLSQLKYNQDKIYKYKSSLRNFFLNYKKTGNPVIDGTNGFDDPTNDNWDSAMNFLERRFDYYFHYKRKPQDQNSIQPLFIAFEDFVKDPYSYLDLITVKYNLHFNSKLKKLLKEENIPRTHHSDGKDRAIYRKIGWVKLTKKKNLISERSSYIQHYNSLGVNRSVIKRLLSLSDKYNQWKTNLYP